MFDDGDIMNEYEDDDPPDWLEDDDYWGDEDEDYEEDADYDVGYSIGDDDGD